MLAGEVVEAVESPRPDIDLPEDGVEFTARVFGIAAVTEVVAGLLFNEVCCSVTVDVRKYSWK